MKNIKTFENFPGSGTPDDYQKKTGDMSGDYKHMHVDSNFSEPIESLVERVLDACKLDVDGIKESDPEFIGYIGDMIQEWYKNQN